MDGIPDCTICYTNAHETRFCERAFCVYCHEEISNCEAVDHDTDEHTISAVDLFSTPGQVAFIKRYS